MSEFVWWDGTWVADSRGQPVVVLFGRDVKTKEVKRFGIKGFKPYFYVPDTEGEYLSCFGDSIRKVTVRLPSDVKKHRGYYDKTFDADILYDMRYVIDKGIYYGFSDAFQPVEVEVMEPRICYFDIEVKSPPEIFPNVEEAKYPIVLLSWYDSYTEEAGVISVGGRQVHHNQVVVESERELIEWFVNNVAERDYDVVTGWNSEEFDIPYLMKRARRCGANIAGLSRMPSRPPDERRWLGRARIDMLKLFKDWSKPLGKQDSYRLKAIVKQPQFGDFEYEEQGAHIQRLVDEDRWEQLVEYSLNDVKALRILDKKVGLFMFYEALRKLVGVKMTDVFSRARIIEYYLMHEGVKPMPTRVYTGNVSDYKGALVVSPEPGIHEMVAVSDLASLYPSIIIAKGLSPDIDKTIPKVIGKLMAVREEMRRLKMEGKATEAMKTSEQSLKYIINAFYGYMGFSGAKMYAPEIAGEVTETGRQISLALHGLLDELGYELVYGDTDSSFFKSIRNVEDARLVENKINEFLVEWAIGEGIQAEYAPTVKLEKIYRRLLFKKKSGSEEAAKKRYAGHLIWKDGYDRNELDYTGIEIKRSDTAPLTKQLLEEFFTHVLLHDDLEGAKQVVVKYEEMVKQGEVSLLDVAIPKGISKGVKVEGAHVKGARIGSKQFGIHFDEMNKPRLLYTKRPWPQVCIDESVSEEEVFACCVVDWEKMCDRVVVKKTKSLLESLGFNWDQVIHGQRSIFDY